MNGLDDIDNNEAKRLLCGLADAVSVNTWENTGDKVLFIRCWVELSRMPGEAEDSLFLKVWEVLANPLMVFANCFVDDLDEDWDDLFSEAEQVCALLQTDLSRLDVCEYVLKMGRDHVLNLASDESTSLFSRGWNHLVWKSGDQSTAPDRAAADSVIAAYAAMFVSLVGSLPLSSRSEVRDLLHDLIEEFYTVVPNFDDNESMGDDPAEEEPQISQPKATADVGTPKRRVADNRASRVTQECNLSPADPRHRTYEQIVKSRDIAIRKNNKIQSKPYYSNDGANYLAEAVARALHCEAIPEGVSVPEWFRQTPENVVIVDARKIVLKVKDSLANAPQATIRGRLLNMYNYFKDVEHVNVHRLQMAGLESFLGEDIDPRYAVALYRTKDALPRYRANAERNGRK